MKKTSIFKRLKFYFIWEKSICNNKGIFIKLTISHYCYIKPTMCQTWDSYQSKPYFDKPYYNFSVCIEKTFFWLWFRLTIKSERLKL